MSDALNQESIAGNVEAPGADISAAVDTTPAATPASPAVEAPAETKPLSLDDALAKAIEKHSPPGEKPAAKGMLPEIPGSKPATPGARPDLKPGQVIDPITQRVLDPVTPPGSLTVALREKWGSVPREFQEFWSKRERDFATSLQETAEARKSWKEFTEVVAPYEATLRTHNITAVAHAKELFNLSHLLNTGTPQTKADVLARLVHQFQPDQQAFAHYLGQRPQGPAPTAPQQPVNVRQEMEKVLKEREEAAKEAEGKSAWDAFAADPKHEFISDVRELMGKILDAELVTGNTYPELFKNAYDLACSQHPEVKTVLAQRTAQTPAAAPTAPVAQPRPNGTVKPSLGASKAAPTGSKKLLSIDEAIQAAQAKLAA
jgi:hypothetical protein